MARWNLFSRLGSMPRLCGRRPRQRRLQVEQLESRDLFAFGDLDASFGTGGLATTSFFVAGLSRDEVADAALQADGKVVSVGRVWIGSSVSLGITRHLADGTLDPTFGDGGIVTSPLAPLGPTSGGRSVAIQPDGKIVVAFGNGSQEVRVARYLDDGQLDATFGDAGIALFRWKDGLTVNEMLLRSNGDVLLVGNAAIGEQSGYVTMAAILFQFDSDGKLDANFGQGGATLTTVRGFRDLATDVAIQSDGKIVVSGTSNVLTGDRSLFVARYSSTGVLDDQFGNGDLAGVVRVDNFGATPWNDKDAAVGVVVQPSGRILLSATRTVDVAKNDFTLIAIDSNGFLDASFGPTGSSGIQTTSIPGMQDAAARDVTLDSVGRILVVGAATSWASGIVARYSSSVILDLTWDQDGIVASSQLYDATRLVIRGDDVPLVIGEWYPITSPNDFDFAVAKLTSSGGIDSAFGVNGVSAVNFFTGNSNATTAISVVQGDGKLVQAGGCQKESGPVWCLVRRDTSGNIDTTFGTNGYAYAGKNFANGAPLVLLAPDDSIILIGSTYSASEYRFQLVKLTRNGVLDTSWGVDGYSNVGVGAGVNYVYPSAVQMQSDGAVLIEGAVNYGSGLEARLYRILSSGNLDSTFGTGGSVQIGPPGTNPQIGPLLLQADGRILTVTHRDVGNVRSLEIDRRLPGGSADNSWGVAGRVSLPIATISDLAYCSSATFLPTGQILVGCRVAESNQLLRFLPNGDLDTAFGVDGLLEFPADRATSNDLASLIALPTGDFASIGWTDSSFDQSRTSTLVQFFKPDGSRNTNAGDNGSLRIDQPGVSNLSVDGLLSADGQLLITGRWNSGIDADFLAARIQTDIVNYRPWRNTDHPLDVSNDASHAVTPSDALLVLNNLNQWGARRLAPPPATVQPYALVDVDGDGWIAPRDALLVINSLNGLAGGEGEAAATVAATDLVFASELLAFATQGNASHGMTRKSTDGNTRSFKDEVYASPLGSNLSLLPCLSVTIRGSLDSPLKEIWATD